MATAGTGSRPKPRRCRSQPGSGVDGAGNLYIAETGANRIRQVDTSGIIHTVAGTGVAGFGGDGGPANQALLDQPSDLVVDTNGSVYVADRGNHRVRVITPDGRILTVAGTGAPSPWPSGACLPPPGWPPRTGWRWMAAGTC